MTSKYSPAFKSIAILLVLSVAQVYVLASPNRALFGRLVTSSDSFIVVNGNDARNGTTILPGAHLQTPAGVTATVQLGSLGRVDIAPGTSLTLNFDEGSVSVEVSTGHAFLATGEGVKGSINTPESEFFLTGAEPMQTQSGRDVQQCLARARRNYQASTRPAKNKLQNAIHEADRAFKLAMRVAKTRAEELAAQNAKRDAIRAAQTQYQEDIKPAEEALRQAEIACKYRRQGTPTDSSGASNTQPGSPGPSFWKIFLPGFGIISGSMLAAIYVPCRRGRNPSPGDPRGRNDECR